MPDYGVDWKGNPPKSALIQELAFFRNRYGSQRYRKMPDGKVKIETSGKGRPRWYHFMQIVDTLWNYPGSQKPFAWHPDAMRMLKAACKYKRLGVAGAGSTGKSDFFAIWAIVTWLSAPRKAMVLVTSTTKGAAANRIWGKIVSYWNSIVAPVCGKLLASDFLICYHEIATGLTDKTFGIKLVAGEAKQEAKSADEIRGIKGEPLLVVVDEMAETGHSLVNTFEENLTANYDNQIIGLANPGTYFDSFGTMCEPEAGWQSVGDDDHEWKSVKGGYVIRLDAELSPNVLEGKVIYPFLMRADQLEEKQKLLGGRDTPAYYRGVRGMWCATTAEQTIYSQAELILSNALKPAVWKGPWTMVAGFDVAFTHDGDRSILTIGKVGLTIDGKLTLEFFKTIAINEDTTIKDVDRTTQVVNKLKAACDEHGVLPENLAIDASGPGGKAFRDAIISKWTNKFLSVDFSGAPSDKPVSKLEPDVKCKDRYDRRVSELWYAGKSLIRGDQLRGVSKSLASEMVIRKYSESRPGSKDNKISVETKRKMKERTKQSPDEGDSFFIMIELCRQRHKFVSLDQPAERKQGGVDPVKKRFNRFQSIYKVA